MSHSTPTVLNTSNEHKEDAGCHEDSQVSSADAGHNHVGDLPNSQLSDFADALDKVGVRAVSTECAIPAYSTTPISPPNLAPKSSRCRKLLPPLLSRTCPRTDGTCTLCGKLSPSTNSGAIRLLESANCACSAPTGANIRRSSQSTSCRTGWKALELPMTHQKILR